MCRQGQRSFDLSSCTSLDSRAKVGDSLSIIARIAAQHAIALYVFKDIKLRAVIVSLEEAADPGGRCLDREIAY